MGKYGFLFFTVALTAIESSSVGANTSYKNEEDAAVSTVEKCAARMASYDNRIEKYEAMLVAYAARVEELERKVENNCNVQNIAFTEKKDERRLVLQDETQVAFYAQLTHDLAGMGNFQTIVFDLVTTNIGNGYNKADGIFTAPVPGVYVFIWTASNMDASHMQTELVANAVVKGRQWSDSGNHNDISSATGSAVLRLKLNDTVWVRSNTVHSHRLLGQQMSSFTGWLLYVQ